MLVASWSFCGGQSDDIFGLDAVVVWQQQKRYRGKRLFRYSVYRLADVRGQKNLMME